MPSESSNPRSEQLNQIIADYLKAVELGNAPDRACAHTRGSAGVDDSALEI